MTDPHILAAKAARKLLALREEDPDAFHRLLALAEEDIDTLREIAAGVQEEPK